LERLRQASAMLDYVELEYGRRPWVHLMRAQAVLPEALRFNSADSVNLAINHSRNFPGDELRAAKMANKIRSKVALAAARAKTGTAQPTSNFTAGPTRAPSTLSRAGMRAVARQRRELDIVATSHIERVGQLSNPTCTEAA
jgi:hypothetical protein